MNKFLSILLVVFLLSSCKYEDKYAFNKNWSGLYTATLDMTEMEPDKDSELIPYAEARDLEAKMNAVNGISGARVIEDREKSIIAFSYSFEDLKAINKLNQSDFSYGSDSPLKGLGQWKMTNKGKKKFFMSMTNLDSKRSEIDPEEVKRMGETFKIKTVLSFHRKVKTITGEMAKQGDKPNEVVIEYTPADMWNPDIKWNIAVKL